MDQMDMDIRLWLMDISLKFICVKSNEIIFAGKNSCKICIKC